MTGNARQLPLPLGAKSPAPRGPSTRRAKGARPEQVAAFHHHQQRQQGRAAWLWAKRQPIINSPTECYLIERGITCPLPPTLGYLPPYGEYPQALIAAFGITDEPEPGELAEPRDVGAVLVIALKDDGSPMRGPRARLLLGRDFGAPITLAPVNDIGGLLITVAPEDALAAHQATGLGAWASGHASRLPALAHGVPRYVEAITFYVRPGSAAEAAAHLFVRILRSDDEQHGIEVLLREPLR